MACKNCQCDKTDAEPGYGYATAPSIWTEEQKKEIESIKKRLHSID